MAFGAIDWVDRAAGAAIEAGVCAHHRRRLARIGHTQQLDPPADGSLWAAGEPPPRHGCALDVLIDGADALPRIAAALGEARSHVSIAGWHVTPEFGLTRDAAAVRLRDLLGELAERVDVRVLLWAGAPLPVFKPTRPDVRRARDALVRGTKISCRLDAHERPMHCHHEKLVLVDDEVAFVGGIDLTSLGGDRYDRPGHPACSRLGWHDAATRLRGPAVADVAGHFAERWQAVGGELIAPPPPAAPAGAVEMQIVRTVAERAYDFAPRGDFRILDAYTRALRSAQSLIYLENQFLWSPEIVAILADKLRHPPRDSFRLVVLLPAKANNGQDDTRGQLALLERADGGRRFLAATIQARTGSLIDPLYVHAKIGVVDDAWLTIGSANLNEHSLFNDSEMNVVTCDPRLARGTRLRLWAEHLERDERDVAGDPAQVIDELWRPIAAEQRERWRRGDPATHHLVELPRRSRRSMALLGPLHGLVTDG